MIRTAIVFLFFMTSFSLFSKPKKADLISYKEASDLVDSLRKKNDITNKEAKKLKNTLEEGLDDSFSEVHSFSFVTTLFSFELEETPRFYLYQKGKKIVIERKNISFLRHLLRKDTWKKMLWGERAEEEVRWKKNKPQSTK